MKASLVSREVIADSIELAVFGHRLDGVVALVGCDKTIPGGMMAMARLNLPSVLVYGGSIMPGTYRGKKVTIQQAFEAVGAYSKGEMSFEEVRDLENRVCPGQGACGGLFTANTMSSAGRGARPDAAGRRLDPGGGGSQVPGGVPAGERVIELLRQNIRPRDILTREAFENAIAVVVAMGGSTNAVLHLTAIAREVGVPLEIDDFDRSAAACRSSATCSQGRYTMPDLDEAGGVPIVVKLAEAGLFDTGPGHRRGGTWADHLDRFPETEGQDVILPMSAPRYQEGGLAILRHLALTAPW